MIPGIDPKIDVAFKKVFGGEVAPVLLPSLIDAVRRRFSSHHVTTVQVLNPFSDKSTLDEKLSILDIKARDDRGQWYDVEMQMVVVVALLQRVLYYWSQVYSEQLTEGESYRQLRPAISICFVNDIVFADRPDDFHSVFKLKNEDGKLCLSDDLEIHILELPKFRKSLNELSDPLDRWLYFLRSGQDLDADKLPAELNSLEIRQAMEVLRKMAHDTIERQIYEGRLKAQRDQLTMQETMEEMHGKIEEMQDVAKKMEQIGRIQLCERLLRRSSTPADDLMAKSVKDLRSLAEKLESELAGN